MTPENAPTADDYLNAAHGTSTELLVSVVRLKAQLAATERENARLNAELAERARRSGSRAARKPKPEPD